VQELTLALARARKAQNEKKSLALATQVMSLLLRLIYASDFSRL